MAGFVRNIWHRYHSRYFKIVSNFTHLTTHEIPYNNFEISLVVFMSNITTNPMLLPTLLLNIDTSGDYRPFS